MTGWSEYIVKVWYKYQHLDVFMKFKVQYKLIDFKLVDVNVNVNKNMHKSSFVDVMYECCFSHDILLLLQTMETCAEALAKTTRLLQLW